MTLDVNSNKNGSYGIIYEILRKMYFPIKTLETIMNSLIGLLIQEA
jgi:hypothetical protein